MKRIDCVIILLITIFITLYSQEIDTDKNHDLKLDSLFRHDSTSAEKNKKISEPFVSVQGKDYCFVFSPSCSLRMIKIDTGLAFIGNDLDEIKRVMIRSNNPGYRNEHPFHLRRIGYFFWMSETEIPYKIYHIYLEETARNSAVNTNGFENLPVVNITWYDAIGFCQWLNQKFAGYYFRLPHEEEWEYAARGPFKYQYPWRSNDISDSLANYGSKTGKITSVYAYSAGKSPWGILNMSGNVYEWCLNSEYKYSADTTSIVLVESEGDSLVDRAVRGGGYLNSPSEVRCPARYFLSPQLKNAHIGLRIVMIHTE